MSGSLSESALVLPHHGVIKSMIRNPSTMINDDDLGVLVDPYANMLITSWSFMRRGFCR
ncbi:MAG: hypothetical protein OEM63_03650 [Gammaproteobacteria bacterium]|nr:hypothetical protein [Gammaproteobacteria bacterium]